MGWEKHDVFIMKNDVSFKTKEIKQARLYRDRFGNLKDYVRREVL
jgi:hypothetical protein